MIHQASRESYGAPRVHVELTAQQMPCCRNTVAKLMRKAGNLPKAIRRFRGQFCSESIVRRASPMGEATGSSVTTVDHTDMRALVSRKTVVRHGAASL